MPEKQDFTTPAMLAKRDAEMLRQKCIKAPDLGKYRIKKGNAIFFFQTKERMKHSIANTKRFEDRNIKKINHAKNKY